MLYKILCISFTFLSFCLSPLFSESQQATTIRWQTNYDQAVRDSKSMSKPLVLFFTGSDWCGWCNKMEEEALDTADFAQAAGNKFIFVKLDFPLYTSQDPQLKTQNKELQQKFDVRSFPTIIVVDPRQNQQIGVTGYRPGGGKSFADYLLKMLNDYSGYKQKVSMLDKSKYSGLELKGIYDKAKELGLITEATKITKKGMASDESLYFMKERYNYLANEGQIHSREAMDLRKQLLDADPLNEKQFPYQLAIIDFETYAHELEKEAPESIIAPLTAYIEKFGTNDKENIWKLQLLISQVYLDKNDMTSALKYVQQSYESAPACAQRELARAVQNIRSQLHSSR